MSVWQEIKQDFLRLVKTHRQLCEVKRLFRMEKRLVREAIKHRKKWNAFTEKVEKYNAKYGENIRLARYI